MRDLSPGLSPARGEERRRGDRWRRAARGGSAFLPTSRLATIAGPVSWKARSRVLAGLLLAALLSGCSVQGLADRVLAPPEETPVNANAAAANTPLPTPTAVVIRPRPLSTNIARLSVKPGEQQEIDVNGTPERYVNVIVSYENGDIFNDATRLGAQLDINGGLVVRWTVDPLASGGTVTVATQDVQTGQTDHQTFQIDARSWGGAPPMANPPLVGYVPYGTPGAGLVAVTAVPTTATPSAAATPLVGQTASGGLQVQAYPSSAAIPVGGNLRINGVLTDAAGQGVAGARLFAIGHFPSGHSEVWVSPAQSGSNGLVWVDARVAGASAGSTILIDVYMTQGGQSYHGQTSVRVG